MKSLSREEIFTILWGQKERTMYSMTRNVFILLRFGQYLPQIESKIGKHQLRKQREHSESVRHVHALLTRPPPRAPAGSAERAPLRLHGHRLHISGDPCAWVLVPPVPKFLTLLGAGTPLSHFNRGGGDPILFSTRDECGRCQTLTGNPVVAAPAAEAGH